MKIKIVHLLINPEHQKDVMRETPWGTMKYIDYKYKIEFQEKEFDIIKDECKRKGLAWSASVWDYDSLDFLINNYNEVPFIKIPSAIYTSSHSLRTDSSA